MPHVKIACLLAADFEDSEFRIPFDRLKAEGFQIDIIGITAGEALKGKKGKETVKAEKSIDEVKASDYQGMLIPGGGSPDRLRIDERVLHFVRSFDLLKRPLAAVCHGPQLLLSARLVAGRKLTAWPTVRVDLELAGAKTVDDAVVIDQNWITSRKPDDLDKFSDALVSALKANERKTAEVRN
jgi:protease I